MSDKPVVVDGIKVNCTLDDIDDIEVAEMMEEGMVVSAMKRVFGDAEFSKIKETFKEKHGKARVSDMSTWFGKVANRLGADAKN